MKTPTVIESLRLVSTCIGLSLEEHDAYMEDTTKAEGSVIRQHIKEHLPDLYEHLLLKYSNPYEEQSVKKDGLFVYVHLSIEYFLEYKLKKEY